MNDITGRARMSDSNKWLILTFVMLASVGLFFQSVGLTPMGDDVFFAYRLDAGGEMTSISQGYDLPMDAPKVSTVGEAFSSQAMNYVDWSGRYLVNVMAQIFNTLLPSWMFALSNAAVLFLAAMLIVRLSMGKNMWRSLWAAFVAVAVLLYVLPSCPMLLLSPVHSLSYLWPTAMTLGAIVIWRRFAGRKVSALKGVGLMLAGLLLGWSHEAFALPLAGVWGVMFLRNRRRYTGAQQWFVIGFWIGAIALFVAPGNFARLSGYKKDGDGSFIGDAIFMLLSLYMLWAWVLTAFYTLVRRRSVLKEFVGANRFWLVLWALSLCLVVMVHSFGKTFIFVEVLSTILLLRLVAVLKPVNIAPWKKKASRIACLAAMTLFLVHYAFVVTAQRRVNDAIADFKSRCATSENGVVVFNEPKEPEFIAAFTRRMNTFEMVPVSLEMSFGRKSYVFVTADEAKAVDSPDEFFVERNRVDGDTPFYTVDGAYHVWGRKKDIDAMLSSDETFVWQLLPPTWREDGTWAMRLRKLMFPSSYSLEENMEISWLKPFVAADGDTLYCIEWPDPRRACGIIRR